MARSTKAEVESRVREISALVCDCMALREVRAWVNAKTEWGASVSDSTLKYYARRARALMKTSATFDFDEELGITKCRLERIIARAAAKGDLSTELAATRQHTNLLGLAAPTRIECSGIDIEAARVQLETEIAEEMADRGTDS
jgi:site-specific recombinase XerC